MKHVIATLRPHPMSLLLASLLAVCGLCASLPAQASDAAKDQAKKMQQMQRKFAQEKAALEGQLREANGRLEESSKKAEEAGSKSAALGGKVRRLEEENRKLSDSLAETRQKLEAENTRLASEGRQLRHDLGAQKASTTACEARSAKLYQYGEELLGLYVNKGVLGGFMQGEPFTGIKRVEVENAYEDYRDKLDAVKPPGLVGSSAAPAAASEKPTAAGS